MSVENSQFIDTPPSDAEFFTLKHGECLYIAFLKGHEDVRPVSEERHRGIVAHETALADLKALGNLSKWIEENGLNGQLRMHYNLGEIETTEGTRYSPGHTIIICPSRIAKILQTAPDIEVLAPGNVPIGLID